MIFSIVRAISEFIETEIRQTNYIINENRKHDLDCITCNPNINGRAINLIGDNIPDYL